MSVEKPTVHAVGIGDDLAAARETIDALVQRYEALQGPLQVDQVAIRRAVATLEGSLVASTRALQASEARFRALFDQGPHMLVTCDREGRICCANQAAARTLGCPATELVGQPLAAFFEESSARRFTAMAERSFEGVVERCVTLRGGVEVALTAAPLPGFQGETQIVLRDLTWRRRLEVELQDSRRLAFLGNLASVVGHEINNPLAVMLGRLEMLLQSDLGDSERVRQQVARVLEHGQRIGRIVQDLQAVARPQKAELEPLAVAGIVSGAIAEAVPLLGRSVVHAELDPGAPDLAADGPQLQQALVHLLAHAADRMRRTGAILLRVGPGPDKGLLASQVSVAFQVADEGPPVPPDLLDQLLEPTIPAAGGRSAHTLGLAIVRNIVLGHGGVLWAENRAEGGVEMGLMLPRGGLSDAREPAAPPERPARLLWVDDDPLMAPILETMLAGTGCTWRIVRTGEEALDLMARQDFDALLVSLQLPGMGGVELHHAASRRDPRLDRRAIYLGGTPRSAPHGVPTLPRPFSRLQLLHGLQRILTTPD